MSNHPIFIDNLAFAKKNERLEGELTLADCTRLHELLQHVAKNSQSNSSPTGVIRYHLQGKTDAIGQHFLLLSITANLSTTCQRCLNDMPLTLVLDFNYLITEASDMDELATDIDNSDDFDLQPASQAMNIIALIEDEIIIAMPIAPIHEADCGEIITQSGEKPNPFAALKGLLKS